MKNIELVKPKLEEYLYEQKLQSDPKTMSYNAGYDVSYLGYNYNTGCISFLQERWEEVYKQRNRKDRYFAYIKDCEKNIYVGYVNYQYNKKENIYECGIVIENEHRNKGYSKDALRLLIKEANKNGIEYLYDTFEKNRENTLKIFLDVGFGIYKETTWKKFGKDVEGVVTKINTNKVLPDISNVKTIEDVLNFMKQNIRYGWLDINKEIHIGNMKNFRKLYKTMSIDEILNYGIGTCIDQVNLMNYLLNKINIKNKMFATRIYEPNDFNDIESEEHMHCFILCYINNYVYQIEHPNWYRIGIYKYKKEQEALNKINKYYVDLSGGISRPITEFYKISQGLSFKEFNNYINNLNITFRKFQNKEEDYANMYKWYQNKFVYEWFEQRKLNYDEIKKKYKSKLINKREELFIIKSNKKDIGYVQIYKNTNGLKLNELKKYKNIYEYDLFVGEEAYLNMGYGRVIIKKINEMIYKKYNADCIIIRTFKRNIRAVKCYKKCGFEIIHEYIDRETLEKKEIAMINLIPRWTFAIDSEKLIDLVLKGKKRATTSLYLNNQLPQKNEISILTDINDNSICMVKTNKVFIKKIKDITWDLAKLEGENKTLNDWKKVHCNFFSKFKPNINENSKVIFEIFEVIKIYKY